MSDPHVTLAALIDRGNPGEDADELLGAIVDGGVFVPVDDQGSVIFIGVDESGPVVPGFAAEASLRQWLPAADGAVLCDALRLLDIAGRTGVHTLAVFSAEQWAKVPLALVAGTLRDRGLRTQHEQTVELTPSTHPLAAALRTAITARIAQFPDVRSVWLADARWAETGNEQLMVHIDADTPAAGKAFLDEIMRTDVTLREDDPVVAVRVFEAHETDAIAELDALDLDPIRF